MTAGTNNRRTFLKTMGLSAASMALEQGATAGNPSAAGPAALVRAGSQQQAAATRTFSEVVGSLYAWDLHDEGIEKILDNLEQMSAVNSVYLIALMHKEWQRPLFQKTYPHNPVRKNYQMEDSRVYWHPEAKRYGRIKPRASDRDWLKKTDWLKALVKAARKRRMKTGVELSHTYIDGERGGKELADCIQRDIYGKRLGKRLCFNNADARQYAIALFSDLTANYDVDFVQTCLLHFASAGGATGARRLLNTAARGGCFCDSCKRQAKADGLDLEKVAKALLPIADSVLKPTAKQKRNLRLLAEGEVTETAVLLRAGELYDWLRFRRDSITRFYKAVHDSIHAIRPKIDLRLNVCGRDMDYPLLQGVDLRALKGHLDSIRICDYSEQSGKLATLEAAKRRRLSLARHAVGDDMLLLSAIGVRPKGTADLVRQGVLIAAKCGVDGITLGHYDGATFERLRAIREGLKLAKVKVKKR